MTRLMHVGHRHCTQFALCIQQNQTPTQGVAYEYAFPNKSLLLSKKSLHITKFLALTIISCGGHFGISGLRTVRAGPHARVQSGQIRTEGSIYNKI